MIYYLQDKKTKKPAKLSFHACDDDEVNVTIGSYGDIYYNTTSYLNAMKVLSNTTDYDISSVEYPNWDDKSFGDDYEIISNDINGMTIHNDSKFLSVLDMVDYKKSIACYMVTISEEKAALINIDHTLTDNVSFPDKISYDYEIYLINYADEKFNDLAGQIVFLGDDNPYNLYYVHAVIPEEQARELKLNNPNKKDYTMLLVSLVR